MAAWRAKNPEMEDEGESESEKPEMTELNERKRRETRRHAILRKGNKIGKYVKPFNYYKGLSIKVANQCYLNISAPPLKTG